MKILTKKLMAIGISAAMLTMGIAACQAQESEPAVSEVTQASDAQNPAGGQIVGGWEKAYTTDINEDLTGVFEAAMQDLVGAEHIPVALLAKQVVSGMNYCFLCESQAVVPDAVPYYTLVYIYSDANGNASVSNIVNVPLPGQAASGDEAMLGGWEYIDPAEVSAAELITSATDGMTGASYEPVEVIASQVVNGTNYAILCYVTPVVPDAESTLEVVTVWEKTDGTVSLGDSVEIDVAGLSVK